MECPDESVLAEYIRGEPSAADTESTAAHLNECDTCRSVVEWLQERSQVDATQQMPVDIAKTDAYIPSDVEVDQTQALKAANFDPTILGPATSDDSLGTLAKYEIREVLGYGGMGVVFSAVDKQLRRAVAIKVLNKDLARGEIARRRFIREARAAAAINHANVVTIYAVDEEHDPPLLSMELVGGKTLREYIRVRQKLDPVETLRIASQIADGLAAAHSHGVIHRDVKPGNIMFEEGVQRVKLTDFGLARVAVDNVELTSHGHVIGTPAYMAPEQVLGVAIDARADLFAFGCVIYAMLTGHSPFFGRTTLQVAHRVTEWNPAPLVESHPAVPQFLSDLVEKLLEKNPDDRFQTASEVADVINAHLAMINQAPTDRLVALASGKDDWPPLSRKPGRDEQKARPWVGPVAAVAVLITIVSVAFLALRDPGDIKATHNESGSEVGRDETASATPNGERKPIENLRAAMTVSKSGDSDFNSIAAAVEHAGPGAVIRVLDDSDYDGPIVIDDAKRLKGLQIVSEKSATLRATSSPSVITIRATPGVVLKGFRMRVALEQKGVDITGACPGLRVQDINVERFENPESVGSFAMIHLHAGAMGTEERPIVLENVVVRESNIGIYIGESASSDIHSRGPSGWIEIRDCDLVAQHRLTGYHIILASNIENVKITRNLLATAACGVSLALAEKNCARDIALEHNTFHDLKTLFVLNDSNLSQDRFAIRHNLIHGDAKPLFDGDLVDLPPHWFDGNSWLAWPGSLSGLEPIATPLADFEFRSIDPASPEYLHVTKTDAGVVTPVPFPGRYAPSKPMVEN